MSRVYDDWCGIFRQGTYIIYRPNYCSIHFNPAGLRYLSSLAICKDGSIVSSVHFTVPLNLQYLVKTSHTSLALWDQAEHRPATNARSHAEHASCLRPPLSYSKVSTCDGSSLGTMVRHRGLCDHWPLRHKPQERGNTLLPEL